MINAAVDAEASTNQTVGFSTGAKLPVGYERASIGAKGMGKTTLVPLMTADGILESLGLPRADILLIDTEGRDAEVLKGAKHTLRKVRYLEFEVQRGLSPWKYTLLRTVVDDLALQGFQCYWALNSGRLIDLAKCWRKEFEVPSRRGMFGHRCCSTLQR